MELQISYYKSSDTLLMQNGHQWADGGNVVENVVAFADAKKNPVAIEVSGAASLLCPILYGGKLVAKMEGRNESHDRPDEVDLDRVVLPLIVRYDQDKDVLTIESGLPTPFNLTIADGLLAFYDGEDEYGKFINAVRLETLSVPLTLC